jgi:hypothetical protein
MYMTVPIHQGIFLRFSGSAEFGAMATAQLVDLFSSHRHYG